MVRSCCLLIVDTLQFAVKSAAKDGADGAFLFPCQGAKLVPRAVINVSADEHVGVPRSGAIWPIRKLLSLCANDHSE